VADSASSYQFLYDSNDLLISEPIGAGGYNLLRVPIPPPIKQ
jgi:hypothetical protein